MVQQQIALNAAKAGTSLCPTPSHVHYAQLVVFLATIATSALSVKTVCIKRLTELARTAYFLASCVRITQFAMHALRDIFFQEQLAHHV